MICARCLSEMRYSFSEKCYVCKTCGLITDSVGSFVEECEEGE